MGNLKIALAQLNYKIGDFERNTAKIADVLFEAKQKKTDLVVFFGIVGLRLFPR